MEKQVPPGTSTKNVIHWSQMIKAKRLQKYDFEDEAANVLAYGQTTPPEYTINGEGSWWIVIVCGILSHLIAPH